MIDAAACNTILPRCAADPAQLQLPNVLHYRLGGLLFQIGVIFPSEFSASEMTSNVASISSNSLSISCILLGEEGFEHGLSYS